jgi:flagellar biosynthesis/type III secretory pathway M-ring protein FliF/YscJ
VAVREKLKQLWQTTAGRVTLGVIILAAVAVLLLLTAGGRAVPLAEQLSDGKRQQIGAFLSQRGETFRVENGRILVPAHRRQTLRDALVLEGLLGRSAFDFARLAETAGDTAVQQRVALQNELARLIAKLDRIAGADVILRSGPGGQSPGATVRVSTFARQPLEQPTVNTIVDLVAAAVPGADAENVLVVTSHPARSYRRSGNPALGDAGAATFALKQRVEQQLASRIESYFQRLNINAVATVSTDLRLEKVRERIRRIDPEDRGPFVQREMRHETTGAVVPEVETDAADGPGVRLRDLEAAKAAESDLRKARFDYERITREIVRAPGEIAQVRASVVLLDRLTDADGERAWNAAGVLENLDRFGRHVANAIGASPEDVEILHLPAAGPPPETAPVAEVAPDRTWVYIAVGLAALILVVLVALRLRRPMPEPVAPPPPPQPEEPAGSEQRIRELRRRIRREFERDPAGVANQLRGWSTQARREP